LPDAKRRRAKQRPADFKKVKRRLEAKLLPLDYVNGIGRSRSDRFNVMLARPISKTEGDHIRDVMHNEGAGDDYELVDSGGPFVGLSE
jgi:hypothetical protein